MRRIMPTTPNLALRPTVYALAVFGSAACAPFPQRIKDAPLLDNGQRIPTMDDLPLARGLAAERAVAKSTMDSLYASAAANCEPAICSAVARGEVLLGMSESQVYAATHTTAQSWTARRSGVTTVLVPASLVAAPRDMVSEIAMVQFEGPRVVVIGYRESQGVRVVAAAADAASRGRNAAAATALVKEGDDLVAANDLVGALNRYDRASVLAPADAELQYKTARILDLQLRPAEALMRYQRFLHGLDLERIGAQGSANAKLADAIATARQRIVVLEKQVR